MISAARLMDEELDYSAQTPAHVEARPTPIVGIAEGYERWAPTYDSNPNPLLACEERNLLPLLPSLKGKSVFDIACGTGRWLQQLLQQDAVPGVGIDLSTSMLQKAAGKSELSGRLCRADCLRLPFAASVFEFAICSFAVSHISDLARFANELMRVMKPSADVHLSDLHPLAAAQGWRTGFRDARGSVEIHTPTRTVEQFEQAFQNAGWECGASRSWFISEEEKPIFARAGRLHTFEEACRVPAIMHLHFRRTGSVFTAARRS